MIDQSPQLSLNRINKDHPQRYNHPKKKKGVPKYLEQTKGSLFDSLKSMFGTFRWSDSMKLHLLPPFDLKSLNF